MANWFTNQKAKRLMMDMPIEHDMHRDGPKNMNKGYGQEVPGGPPMYDTDEGGPPMHDEFTRKNNIKHDGPKMHKKGHGDDKKIGPGGASPKKSKSITDQVKSSGGGAKKGDQSATRFDYKNYKGTDKGYKGKDGSSHGDQSATRKDFEEGKKPRKY